MLNLGSFSIISHMHQGEQQDDDISNIKRFFEDCLVQQYFPSEKSKRDTQAAIAKGNRQLENIPPTRRHCVNMHDM